MKHTLVFTLLLLFSGFYAYSFDYSKILEENKNLFFEVQDCPTTVDNNTITPSATTICEGESVSFTGSTPDIAMEADTTYQWQSDASGSWLDIGGATDIDYTAGSLTESTSFRRAIRITGCDDFYSSETLITVESVSSPIGDAAQTFCEDDTPTIADLVTSASNPQWYSDEALTTSISTSTALTDASTYYVTDLVGSCESAALAVTAEITSTPSIESILETDPTVCGGNGTIQLTFTNVPDGTYIISYDDGSFSSVNVSSGSASISAAAGTYNNLLINVEGCTSSSGVNASLSDPNPPAIPTVEVVNECGQSTLTASNYSGDLTWSTSETTESIIVNNAGTYSVTQTLNGCTSEAANAIAAPKTIPTLSVLENNPTSCGGSGSIDFTLSGVPDGTYTISYDGGSFSDVAVASNAASVSATAGTYNNLTITVDGCTSLDGENATLTDPDPPAAPSIDVSNECGQTILTASNYSGNLTWSTTETTESIIVTTAGTYSVTQTLNGCTSEATEATAAPIETPTISVASTTNPAACGGNGTIQLTFSNVPDGTYTITYDGGSFSSVTVSSGSASISATAGTYNNLLIDIEGCTSVSGVNASLSDPNPPSAPSIDISNECGQTTLTASDYTGTLNWSTGETTNSIVVTEPGTYSVQQTLSGCTSEAAEATAAPKTIPTLSVLENNPTSCGGSGSIDFTFSGVPDGTYTISYDGGSFSGVAVASNAASISATAGTYNNLTITVDGCTSLDGENATLTDPDPPAAPSIDVSNECGQTTLTASNYSGDLTWSTTETTESIIVTTAGTYSVTQTLNGCTSEATEATAAPKTVPTLSVLENDPSSCGGNGSINFTFTGVTDGTYTIIYDSGSFDNVEVTSGSASVSVPSGTYNNLKIKVDDCESASGINASLSDPNAPNAPEIQVDDLCGESVLTAVNYEEGATLNWSTGDVGESIVVTSAQSYSLTQELNGCMSEAATAETAPKIIPDAPDFEVINNCDGTSTLTATEFDEAAQLEWNTGDESESIIVSLEGDYYLKQILDGCESDSVVKTAVPKTAPNILASANDPETCGSQGSIDFTFTNVPDNTYTILFDEGSFEEVVVSNGEAAVPADAGSYTNLKITVNNCESEEGVSVSLSDPDAPDAPNIIIDNQCGQSLLTATGVQQDATLNWSNGDTTVTIYVQEAGTYSVTQTLNGCTSPGRSANATPKDAPETPDFSVTNNCDGTSTLTATQYDNDATLVWSTNEYTKTITVEEEGNYSLYAVLNGCQSDEVTKTASPKNAPTINLSAENPENCGEEGTLNFSFTNVPGGIYDISYDNGTFVDVTVSNQKASLKTTVGAYNNLQITINDCSSETGVNAVLTEPNAPSAPSVIVIDNCSESILIASNFDEAATLIWNTGFTGDTLTVTEAGTYSVAQNLNGCTSLSTVVEASPKVSAGTPEVEVIDDCGESTISMSSLPDNTWFVWTFNGNSDSTQNNSITLTEAGDYTLFQKIDGCSSEDTTVSINPLDIPLNPVSDGDILVCRNDADTSITAGATVTDSEDNLVWYDALAEGNVVLSPTLNTIGTITYYAEAQNKTTGCPSETRTPVKLTILQSAKTLIADSTVIGKPQNNVAVLIFPENLFSYQWYLNNSEITGATGQYYYIPEEDRKSNNVFSIEVGIENGCNAMFNYTYEDLQSSSSLTDYDASFLFNNTPSFKIYPNPANDLLNISVDLSMFLNEQKITSKIFSSNGTLVDIRELSNTLESISTSNFSPGIYSVILYGDQGSFYSQKLIIKH